MVRPLAANSVEMGFIQTIATTQYSTSCNSHGMSASFQTHYSKYGAKREKKVYATTLLSLLAVTLPL